MEDLIADYERTRGKLLVRILCLKKQIQNKTLMTKQRERLNARIKLLDKEHYELLEAINEMRRRY